MTNYIIVGAGILGATTAYKLAKAGKEVTIIDRENIGQATDAAAGVICPWLTQRRNKAWYHLAKSGARILPDLVQELEKDGVTETGYRRVGGLRLENEDKKLEAIKERALERRKDAPEIGEVTLLSEEETKQLVPFVADGYKAIHVSGAARLDGRTFRDSLLTAAQKHGATFIHGEATLNVSNQKITSVSVEGESLKADTIIATCGAWMKDFLAPLGINFQSYGQRGQLIHFQVTHMETDDLPVLMPPTNQSIVPFKDKIVVGATHEDDTGFDLRVTAGGIHDILAKALTVFPGLTDSTFVETRVGFRPFTPEFLPVIGTLPEFPNVLIANGLGSSGLTTGPYVGGELAKLALGEELDINLADYDIQGAIKK